MHAMNMLLVAWKHTTQTKWISMVDTHNAMISVNAWLASWYRPAGYGGYVITFTQFNDTEFQVQYFHTGETTWES